jgi:hypothetical protein
MIDRPDAARLLGAMAETLTDEVVPATRGGAQHAARVVANLCRILERETRLGREAADATRSELARLLDRDASLPELARALDDRLRGGRTQAPDTEPEPDFEARAHAVLLSDVRRRLAIDRPGYDE